jgi:hypothetical protein
MRGLFGLGESYALLGIPGSFLQLLNVVLEVFHTNRISIIHSRKQHKSSPITLRFSNIAWELQPVLSCFTASSNEKPKQKFRFYLLGD